MTAPRKNAATTRGKPFEPGNAGRPRGARHRTTLAIEALLEGEHEKLTRKAIEKALEGDVVALRLCLDRVAPARKDAPIAFDMPKVETAEDTLAASASVLAAVAGGDITPEEGARVMALLAAHRGIIDTANIEARLRAVEETIRER